ncbi:MAG: hypothetical protein ACK6CU_26160 [Deltaproteobacteria bacterium]|jgi:hypothetical protein
MLPPDARKLYVDALSPPTGYELDEALCTTCSLSLESLLAVPVNLVDDREHRDRGHLEHERTASSRV